MAEHLPCLSEPVFVDFVMCASRLSSAGACNISVSTAPLTLRPKSSSTSRSAQVPGKQIRLVSDLKNTAGGCLASRLQRLLPPRRGRRIRARRFSLSLLASRTESFRRNWSEIINSTLSFWAARSSPAHRTTGYGFSLGMAATLRRS